MNLTEPLEGVMSAVEAAVLRVLSRSDTGFSGRQIHSLAGAGSTSSVHRALAGLVRLGLVTAEQRPPAIIYRANRDHILWPVIDLGLSARSRALDSIAAFCADLIPDEVPEEWRLTVVVYGSVARRDSTIDSDLDLLIVFPDDFDTDARADIGFRIAEHARRITGNDVQIFPLDRSEVDERIASRDPFMTNVLSDGRVLAGRALLPLSHEAA